MLTKDRAMTSYFPLDDYTPYGYLDSPAHTRNLTPRGVVRSYAAGFRWHFPAYPGMYGGRRETYRAGVRIALAGALDLADFDSACSPYHTKNVFVFELRHGVAHARVEWHVVGEHALRATISARHASRVTLHMDYERLLAANGEWGESGLVGRAIEEGLLLQGFEDGDVFLLWAARPPDDIGITADPDIAAMWAGAPAPGPPTEGFAAVVGRRGERVGLYGVAGFARSQGAEGADAAHADQQIEIILVRGRTEDAVRRHLAEARRAAPGARARLLAEDDAFWARAPRLDGDWPGHWRRGLVYDLETVRMMVKAPSGIYSHVWDAMQIQAPRVVLAEAAIDALLLAYADPSAAQSLLLGVFLDAPAPNVPCSREDGAYNMVAADGSVCGTAPPWGYPWLVIAWLAALNPDQAWIERLYPRLADYLEWWLAYRRDADGWLVYACSWESGQDDSPRFGAQPLGGGHPVRHVRPTDLQAAFAHAAVVMADLADTLARSQDAAKWRALAREFAERTDQLWRTAAAHPRYADFDALAGRLTDTDDVMLLAPLALGVADEARIAALRPVVAALDADTLTWPMFAWTAVEAALAADLPDVAAELAWAVCERAYSFWDARTTHSEGTLPGIACEYWPLDGRCGGEGYGWGAFTTHLLLHVLLGMTPTRKGLLIRPNLPTAWRVAGRRYGVQLDWRERPVTIVILPLDQARARVEIDGRTAEVAWGEALLHAWK